MVTYVDIASFPKNGCIYRISDRWYYQDQLGDRQESNESLSFQRYKIAIEPAKEV
jgi:hypothetical protein